MKNNVILVILLVLLGMTIYLFFDSRSAPNDTKKQYSTTEITAIPLATPDSSLIRKRLGKTIFFNNCAQCHNINMKDVLTGPALDDAITRWSNDTVRMLQYLWNPKQYLSDKKDMRMISLHKEHGKVQKDKFKYLTLNELKSVIFFIESDYHTVVN